MRPCSNATLHFLVQVLLFDISVIFMVGWGYIITAREML